MQVEGDIQQHIGVPVFEALLENEGGFGGVRDVGVYRDVQDAALWGGGRQGGEKDNKDCFSEEMKQKTFDLFVVAATKGEAARRKSFLVLFFKKEHPCLSS
jgi:hypothetical protein